MCITSFEEDALIAYNIYIIDHNILNIYILFIVFWMMAGIVSDEEIFHILEDADMILSAQNKLAKRLSQAFFQLALAKKTGSLRTDPENLRSEIDPSLILCNKVPSLKADVELCSDSGPPDSVLLFSAMPNPNLKSSKAHFLESLRVAVECANKKRELIELLSRLEL
jgi:hypothetical protein